MSPVREPLSLAYSVLFHLQSDAQLFQEARLSMLFVFGYDNLYFV